MAKENKKEQRYHNSIPIDSDEEYFMLLWLEELMDAGFIDKIERAETFVLSERFVNEYEEVKELKTKSKTIQKEQILLEKHVYTPEFKITLSPMGVKLLSWRKFTRNDGSYYPINSKFTKLFVEHYGGLEHEVYLEIKPEWDQNNMERLFKINRAWVYQKYGVFINLIKPLQLFEKTFTPKAYMTTTTGKKRVIHFETRTLDQYILENGNTERS